MNKNFILEKLIARANEEVEKAESNYESTKKMAKEDDIKAESKWDMRKQEASYLAQAHQKRTEELKIDIKMLEEIELKNFSDADEVAIGALVSLKYNQIIKKYFLAPTFGGQMINLGNETILVISVFSPIGSELLGLKVNDSFELELSGGIREYQVMHIE